MKPSSILLIFSLISLTFPVKAKEFVCDQNWLGQESGIRENLKRIDWDGNRFVVFANTESDYIVSEEGIHWRKSNPSEQNGKLNYLQTKLDISDAATNFLSSAVFANGIWVTFIENRIYSSKDKIIWHITDADDKDMDEGDPEIKAKNQAARKNMRWIKIADGKVYISSDGHTWNGQKTLCCNIWWRLNIGNLFVVKNKFVAINLLGAAYASENGENWSPGSIAERPGGLASNGEDMVLAGWYGNLMISKDAGKSWQTINSAFTDEAVMNHEFDRIIWLKNQYIVPAASERDVIWHSVDGINWERDNLTTRPVATPNGKVGFNNIAWNGEHLVSIGNAGAIYTAACHPSEQLGKPDIQTVKNQPASNNAGFKPGDLLSVQEMDFILVQGGCFAISNPTPGESPPTSGKTCVKDFWLGVFEVSQSDWTGKMQNNPAYFQKGGDFPVENISFLDIQNYLKKLNQFGKYTFRLPSEAEWEYACKSGGNKETYAGGENPDSLAWYKANSGDSSHAVGRKMPNGLGLFDMSGNVEEWVQDYYDKGKTEKEEFHVIRGGSWSYKEKFIRCDRRGYGAASGKEKNLGLRLVIEKNERN